MNGSERMISLSILLDLSNVIPDTKIENFDEISNYSSKQKNKKENTSRLEYSRLNICNILYATFCFWASKKQKRRHRLISKAETKIHYYLDIYTYKENARNRFIKILFI